MAVPNVEVQRQDRAAPLPATADAFAVHWKGGVPTELRVPRQRSGQTRKRVPVNVIEAGRGVAHICSDDRIAGWLTRNGLQTSGGNCWTRQHVTGLRNRHGIPV